MEKEKLEPLLEKYFSEFSVLSQEDRKFLLRDLGNRFCPGCGKLNRHPTTYIGNCVHNLPPHLRSF